MHFLRAHIHRTQNFWVLASIQGASLGLPGMLVGGAVAENIGKASAYFAIFLGNIFLWLIGLSIITMSEEKKNNSLDIVKSFLGKVGMTLAGIALIGAFITWYSMQLSSAILAFGGLLNIEHFWGTLTGLRVGALLGILVALISISGIKSVRNTCVYVFPLLFIYVVTFGFMSENFRFSDQANFTFSSKSIISVISVILPGIVNLPTFFRHSKSTYDSVLGLTLFILFTMFFQAFSVLIGVGNPTLFFSKVRDVFSPNISIVLSILFVTLSLICINLVNIYFASAVWENLVRKTSYGKEFAIIGLMGTAAYTFMQVSTPMLFLQTFTNDVIGALGVVLIVAFVIKLFVKHRPRKIEKTVNVLCWIVGSAIGTTYQIMFPNDPNGALLATMGATLVSFLVAIFIEETIWSGKILLERNFAWFEE